MNKNGLSTIVVVSIVAAAVAGVGLWYYMKTQSTPYPSPSPSVSSSPTPLACTLEAKACPDGSFVGRVGPNCEFAPCPSFDTPPSQY